MNDHFIKTWWYAIRPHTLFASIAPMIIATGALIAENGVHLFPLILCFIVAISAQAASNLANDYFDFKKGSDTQSRIGFKRLLSQGRVTPNEMLTALIIVMAVCALSGLILATLQGWELLIIGVATLLGLLAYSTGPFPLSRIGLGDIAVVIFFGLVPVLATYYAINGVPPYYLICLALAIGIWETNILVVNNYRDYNEDIECDKKTLVVRLGRASGPTLYLINAVLTILLTLLGLILEGSIIGAIVISIMQLIVYSLLVIGIHRVKDTQLNGLQIYTSRIALITALLIMIVLII